MRSSSGFATACIAVLLLAVPTARAATLEPVAVFSDATLDNVTAEDTTPLGGSSDLTGGLIGETDDAITFSWQVADLNDLVVQPIPQYAFYLWDFQISDGNGKSALFQVRARLYPSESIPVNANNPSGPRNDPDVPPYWPWGQLQGDCIQGAAIITCSPIAKITATVDPAANTITVATPRALLKSSDGTQLAIDGGTIEAAHIFDDVASCIPAGVVLEVPLCDNGVMDDVYTLGMPR